jgi:hypothetical protein
VKINKTALSFLSILLFFIKGYAQSDSIYAKVNVYEPANFKEVYLPQHTFLNPSIDFNRMSDNFIPEAKTSLPNQYENHTLNGKIKKITKFYKYPKEKRIADIHYFNSKGLLEKVNFMVFTNVHYHYDIQNRLIRKETIRDKDTLNIRQYSYNNKNQITEYRESHFEKGQRRDAHWAIIYEPENNSIFVNYVQPDQKTILVRKIKYDGNKVKSEEYSNGKLFPEANVEFIYSENNNLISRKSHQYNYFYSYDKQHRNTKEVNIRIGKTWDVSTKSYDKNGYITHFYHENPVSKSSGSPKFQYDKFNNKIYEASGPDISVNPYEYIYEIEYY